MKNRTFPIDLIAIVTEKDVLDQIVEKERDPVTVFAEISSVTQTEFFNGGRLGLSPSLKATIYDFEYNGEQLVKFNGTVYSVYRTYAVNDSDRLELYLEERGGTKDESSSNDSTP